MPSEDAPEGGPALLPKLRICMPGYSGNGSYGRIEEATTWLAIHGSSFVHNGHENMVVRAHADTTRISEANLKCLT